MRDQPNPCIRRTSVVKAFTAAFLLAWSPSILCEGQTLGEALNATNLTWTTTGTGLSFGWSPETTHTHDGVLAAGSGTVNFSSSTSTLQTTVTGPGTLTYWWSDPSMYNWLTFSAAGTQLAGIIFYPSWQQRTIYLGSGTQTLRWLYTFSAPGDYAQGYVDEVSYVPGATAPVITAQPLSQSQVPGCSTTFAVSAGGTPPLYYQWRFGAQEIAGATASSLTVTNVQAPDLGTYTVTASNNIGTLLSSSASLEFGQLAAWGQAGYGATMTPPGASNILAVAAGYYFGLALKPDGTLLGWGNDTLGWVTRAAKMSNVVAIAAREDNALALTADGGVSAWGDSTFGATNVPGDLTNAVAIAAGFYHNLALTSDGRVVAWGGNNSGQTNVPAGLSNVVAIAAGLFGSVAVKADGRVVEWGSGPALPADLSNIVAVAGGPGYYLALRDEGTILGWGDNSYGRASPPAGLSNVVAIAGGDVGGLALLAGGTVVAWGYNVGGLTNVPAALTNVVAIAAGSFHNVAQVGAGPPITKALMNDPQLSGSGFRVWIPSQSGHVYSLEYKNALDDAGWVRLPLVAGNGTNLVLQDPGAGAAQRFYRVRRW